jgi:hypothetical protein
MFMRVLLASGVAGAASAGAMIEPKVEAREASAAPGPVLVEIVGRDSAITVRASDDGPRYSTRPNDPGLTLRELDQRDPAFADRMRGMWAGM